MSSILAIVSAGLGVVGAISQRQQKAQAQKYANAQARQNYEQQIAELDAQKQDSAEQSAKEVQEYQEESKNQIAQSRANMAASGIDLSSESYTRLLSEQDAKSAVNSSELISQNSKNQAKYNNKKYALRNNYMEQNLLGSSKYAWGGIGSVINQFSKFF